MAQNTQIRDSSGLEYGEIPGMHGQSAFVLHARVASPIPVLIAVPHAGRAYSPALLRDWRHPRSVLSRLEDRHVDAVALRVAQATGACLMIAHAPRALIDLNRAPDDVDWDMLAREARPSGAGLPSRRARSGLGLVPRSLAGAGELWRRRLSGAELAERIEQVHAPYHDALAATLAQLRERWGAALLIDLHSMPPLPQRDGQPAAEIVVGDRFGASCHGGLIAETFAHFATIGRRAVHNRPYAGGYVLERHANPRHGLHALQIELDRRLYLDADMDGPGAGLPGIVSELTTLVERLAASVGDLGDVAGWAQAAE